MGSTPGTATDPALLTVAEAVALQRRGELGTVELVTAVLDRIDRVDPTLEAYVDVYRDQALAAAELAQEAQRRGEAVGPLHGVPVALKDLYDVAGRPTLAGSRVRTGHLAEQDAESTRRLNAAGAIVLGKTVTHEFAYGVVSAPTRNPWDLDTIPGGSSGGSGAAVAADLCLAAMGSDTGGSIRMPAGLTGVVGLKATFGRVSKRGVAPLSASLDHAGPLTKTVEDAALLLQVLAGYDPADQSSLDVSVPDYLRDIDAGIRGLRIGVPTNYFFERLDPDVERCVQAALEVLRDAGAVLVDITVPDVELSADVVMTIASVEASAVHQDDIRSRPLDYTDEVRGLLRAGELVSGTAYVNAQRARGMVKEGLRRALQEVDVIASATLPLPASPYGADTAVLGGVELPVMLAMNALTVPANAAGLPALAQPCGFTPGGMPVSLQLMGRPFDEATILRVGLAYEAATAWHHMSPPDPA